VSAIREVLASNENRLNAIRKALVQTLQQRESHEQVYELTQSTPKLIEELLEVRKQVQQGRAQLEAAMQGFNDLRMLTNDAESENRQLNIQHHDSKTQLEHRRNMLEAVRTEHAQQSQLLEQLIEEISTNAAAVQAANEQMSELLETDKQRKLEWMKLRSTTGLEVLREAKTVPQAIELRNAQLKAAHADSTRRAQEAEEMFRRAEREVAEVEQELADMRHRIHALHSAIETHREQTLNYSNEIAEREREMGRLASLRQGYNELHAVHMRQVGCSRETRKLAKDALAEIRELRQKLDHLRKTFETAKDDFMSKCDALVKDSAASQSKIQAITEKSSDLKAKCATLEQQRTERSTALTTLGMEKEQLAKSTSAELEDIRRHDAEVAEEIQQVEETLHTMTLKLHEIMQARTAVERSLKQQQALTDFEATHAKQRKAIETAHMRKMNDLTENYYKLLVAAGGKSADSPEVMTPDDIANMSKEDLLLKLKQLEEAVGSK